MLTACERYYYNNDQSRSADIVNLKGGEVTFNNGLVSTSKVDKVTLDEEGGGSYIFTPENVTLLLTDEDALRSMSVTLFYDGTYYDVTTLKAYVMAATAKSEGRRIVAAGRPHLFDILRDPPGGESHSYLESGAEMSYSYTANLDPPITPSSSSLPCGGARWQPSCRPTSFIMVQRWLARTSD